MKTKLYVKNLSVDTIPSDLMELFYECGEVLSIDIPRNRASGLSTGFALVTMKDSDSANRVIKKFNNTIFKNFTITINRA